MAFDKDRHEYDSRGFMVEKDTKQVVGQAERWFTPTKASEYPKWVKPRSDLVVEVNGHKLAPLYPDFAVDRATNEIVVLVHDAAEEEHATHVEEKEEKPRVTRKSKNG